MGALYGSTVATRPGNEYRIESERLFSSGTAEPAPRMEIPLSNFFQQDMDSE
jgi:hypothetical protein